MKTQQICKDFLRMRKGASFDPIQARQWMLDVWGIAVDWHEMSDALETLLNNEEAQYDGMTRDGMHIYLIL